MSPVVRWRSISLAAAFIATRIDTFIATLIATLVRSATNALLKQLQDASVLIEPAFRVYITMRLHGLGSHLPVLFFKFNQTLGESHRVFKKHIVIEHPVTDQEVTLQPFDKFNRRADSVGLRIDLR